MANLINNIKKIFGENIILILGNWSPSKQMRGLASTPNKGLFKKILSKIEGYLFDEYKTTKVCNSCKSEHGTIQEKKRINPKPNKTNQILIHGLLRCKNEECSKLLNRDLNGSTNIGDGAIYYLNNREIHPAFRRIQPEIVDQAIV